MTINKINLSTNILQNLYGKSFIEEIEKLKKENIKFEFENTLLNNKILELEKEKFQLKKENKKLKETIANLSKTSKTSNKPPSSDIVKGTSQKNKKSKRKQGAQPGHKKHERAEFPEEEINNFHEYTLAECPDCSSTDITVLLKKTKVIQQIEIKEVPIQIDEHKGYAYWCNKCKKIHYAPIPLNIVKAGLFGPRLTAFVGYMKSALHASFSTIRKYLRDVIKIKISRGQLAKLLNKVGESLNFPYDELLNKIPLEKKINVDETSHKNNGDLFWTWCFRADLYILFKID
jgi:transposase